MPRLRMPPQGRQAAAVVQEPEPDQDLDLKEELEVQDDPEEQLEDPTIALKAQIEALKKSEQEANARVAQLAQEREEAIRRARENEAEVSKLQEQTVTSQSEAISAALAGAQSEAEAAQQEIEMAAQLGDMAAQAKAYRRLARAEAQMLTLENGKAALERQAKEKPEPRAPMEPTQEEKIRALNLPPLATEWLIKRPQYVFNPRLNAKVQALHWDVVDEGYEPYSREYFEALEDKLTPSPAKKQEPDVVDDEPAEPPTRKAVSAPPSREALSASSGKRNSRITLTAAHKEAAKIAGVSEEEYAKGLLRLAEEKGRGNYGGGS